MNEKLDLEDVCCNLCGSGDGKTLFQGDYGGMPFSVTMCGSCGLIYLTPRFSRYQIEEDYNRAAKSESYISDAGKEKELYRERFNKYLNEIEKHKREKGKILDIGCAIGLFLDAAVKRGWDAYGVEISNVFVEYARTEMGLNVQRGQIEDIKDRESCFDVITMWHVLEHTLDPRLAVSRAYDLLKEDGLLALEVPNGESEIQRAIKTHPEKIKPYGHLYYFSRETLTRLLESVGFSLITSGFSEGTGCGTLLRHLGLNRLHAGLIDNFHYLRFLKGVIGSLKKHTFPSYENLVIYARK